MSLWMHLTMVPIWGQWQMISIHGKSSYKQTLLEKRSSSWGAKTWSLPWERASLFCSLESVSCLVFDIPLTHTHFLWDVVDSIYVSKRRSNYQKQRKMMYVQYCAWKVLIHQCSPVSDINECEVNNGGCSQNCMNQAGNFLCSCMIGYQLLHDSRTCEGVATWVRIFPCAICD